MFLSYLNVWLLVLSSFLSHIFECPFFLSDSQTKNQTKYRTKKYDQKIGQNKSDKKLEKRSQKKSDKKHQVKHRKINRTKKVRQKDRTKRSDKKIGQKIGQNIGKNNIIYNIYTCFFFENRATKTCQSLVVIGNLMPFFSGKVKSHLKKKFLNT